MKQLTQEETDLYIALTDDRYYRLRMIQLLEKLAEAHGCTCSEENEV